MKRTGVLVLFILVLGLVAVMAVPDGRGPLSLIRIPASQASLFRTLARLQTDVRQELSTCLLALADRNDLDRLRRSGVRFSVLERRADGREFLLVEAGRPGALESLRAAGRAVLVESGTAVFWTDEGTPSQAVPSGLPRKALPPRSVLRYLRPRPAPSPDPLTAPAQDPFIETIVDQVSSSSLNAGVQTLQGFQTRYASTSNCDAAAESLFSAFTGLGLDEVRFDPFTYSGSRTSRNVVAQKTGRTYPDDIYIICAHYDSTSPSATRETLAPGADDNASGTAAVLEAARTLAAHPFDFTVRFVAFSAEEWGLYGSRAYAGAARMAGERILGVINLDMIGYANARPEDLELIVNADSGWLAELFLVAATHYGPVGAVKTVDPSVIYSDHSPFWDVGYPALLAIEDYPLNNPYYHQTTDTLDRLDAGFFTCATRAAVGLLAGLAQPVKDGYPGTPVGLAAAPIVYSSLFSDLKAVRLTWDAASDAAGYNIYRTTSPHLGYVKINEAPVTGAAYTDGPTSVDLAHYYVITAVGPTGLESNRSREAGVAAGAGEGAAAGLAPLILRGPR
jgi:hypothetical protein